MDDTIVITEREVLAEVLELYRDLPGLWDTTHELYNNREARNQGYQTLYECYSKYDKNITVIGLKKKLENMRTAYKREKKKVEKSLAEDSRLSLHVPSLWYYPYFSFLEDEVDPIAIENSNNYDSCDVKSDDLIDEPERKKSKRVSRNNHEEKLTNYKLVKKQMDLIETAKTLLSSNTGECSADAFGRSISCQLKELPKIQRCLAEKLIGEVIYYAKMDQLNVDTLVYLNDDSSSKYNE